MGSGQLEKTIPDLIAEGSKLASDPRADLQPRLDRIRRYLRKYVPQLESEYRGRERSAMSSSLILYLSEPVREILKLSCEPASAVLKRALRRIPAQLYGHRNSLTSSTYGAMLLRFRDRLNSIGPPDPTEAVRTILWGSIKQDGLQNLLQSRRRMDGSLVDELLAQLADGLSLHVGLAFKAMLGEAAGRAQEMIQETRVLLQEIMTTQHRAARDRDQCDLGGAAHLTETLSDKARDLRGLLRKLARGLEPDARIYYQTGIPTPHVHYGPKVGEWPHPRGILLGSSEFTGYAIAELYFGDAQFVHACFHDGAGNWDNNEGKNYRVVKGVHTLKQGVFSAGPPSPGSSNET